jgi:hypothetical protein
MDHPEPILCPSSEGAVTGLTPPPKCGGLYIDDALSVLDTRAWADTKLLTWERALSTLGLLAIGEALTAGAGLRTPVAAVETVGLALLAYLTVSVLEYFVRLVRAPAHIHHDLEQRATDLEKAEALKADVEIRREDGPEERLLVVRNVGANAVFRAQIRGVERRGDWRGGKRSVYDAIWEGKNFKAEIHNGLERRLRLAKLEAQAIHLYFFNHDSESHLAALSARWLLTEPPLTPPVIFFRVTITANTEMRRGPVTRNFELTTDGLRDLPDDYFGSSGIWTAPTEEGPYKKNLIVAQLAGVFFHAIRVDV